MALRAGDELQSPIMVERDLDALAAELMHQLVDHPFAELLPRRHF